MRGTTGGVLGLLAVAASWGVFWGGWAALIPDLKATLGLDTRELGLSLFAIPIAAVPAMAFTGRLANRVAQHTLPLVTALFAAGIGVVAFAGTVPVFVAGLLLVGAASGAIEVALNATAAAHEARDGVRLFNKVHAATPLAMVLAGPSVGLARQLGVSRTAVLLVVAAVVLGSAALAVDRRGWRGADTSAEHGTRRAPVRWMRPFLLVGAVAAAVLLMENAVEQWGAVHLEQNLGAGPLLGSAGPAAYMAGLSVGRMLAQWKGALLPDHTLVRLGAAVGGVGLAVGAFATSPYLTLAGFAFAGIGLAPVVPTLLAAVGRAAGPRDRSTAISVVTTTGYAGFLASPPLVGLLAAGIGLPPALGVVAGLGLMVLLGAHVLRLLANNQPAEYQVPG
ncbi:MFS transporter [Actinophytocola sp.]|uniref:MFS transporter n=1 Tax=Actinophytocola sp. TaxID=1872138 RepID=UPI002ED37477